MKLLSDEEIKLLSKNKYVKSVSGTKISYTDEFKDLFVDRYKKGVIPSVIFREAGFDVKIIGQKRIERSAARWRQKAGVKAIERNIKR